MSEDIVIGCHIRRRHRLLQNRKRDVQKKDWLEGWLKEEKKRGGEEKREKRKEVEGGWV